MILEIKTTRQFNAVAERLFNENISKLRKDMPAFYISLMKDKKEMGRFIEVVIDLAKNYFYEGHDERSGYCMFRKVNQKKSRAFLRSLAFTHQYVYKNVFAL
ncbi:hypothetical protein [Pantoea sp. MT58]|uniref:hypothetical protein n=1 Tax=Pantoea sp. MT58 TaxID=2768165 RepID=UPI00165A3E63|nr:hypothetical protein [Pantoea sp. MT58]QNQ60072.1 hypothetical protein IAI47_07475 [Pantoea sp. MT58]